MTMEVGAIGSPTDADGVQHSVRPEHAVSRRFNELQRGSGRAWRYLIRAHIEPNYRRYFPPDPKRDEESVRQSHLDKLLDLNEFDAISELWATSAFVVAHELECAGVKRGRPLCKQSFARRLQALDVAQKIFLDPATYEGRAGRLVDAMLSFGLLEEDPVRKNLKILRPTQLLHVLMVTFHTDMALRWENSVGPKAANDDASASGEAKP